MKNITTVETKKEFFIPSRGCSEDKNYVRERAKSLFKNLKNNSQFSKDEVESWVREDLQKLKYTPEEIEKFLSE